ncbi:bacitracin ABC transporter ATP-binding protein [Insulibacter thermoxylanivorax]|uniref:Bacitracin ABC transporter ATP-binding protein n=1 Tax=Insulibacter thermoxylanivorax TaxID=2749268 RepID=A0A916QGW6_9BACL|nr:ABC transporter ATP-binding protein [Insulibacter thermoxylanivorax]GFR38793.1 bacitracin ABC transporter ATP-binding protein [Insulibacter thermoxylanivorax]
MEQVIATQQLSKRYGNVYRVKQVNLTVQEGEIYGFLGPNGAGKSTTLKMILGLVRPTEGKVTVFGKDLDSNRRQILAQTGALIESPSFYGHLTGLENMRVVQRLRDVPDQNVKEALSIVRLDKAKDKRVDQYSLGMKQRLGIAMALVSFPKLLILDEPTNGLDPAGIGEIRELIKSLPQRYEMTVLISSHLLSEIEQIATSVGIIHEGEMLFQGSLEQLQNRSRPAIKIKTGNNPMAQHMLLRQGYAPVQDGEFLALEGLRDEQAAEINRLLVTNDIDVLRIEEHKKNLESIFLDMTGKESSL